MFSRPAHAPLSRDTGPALTQQAAHRLRSGDRRKGWPAALKWSVAVGVNIVVALGLLGWIAVSQQKQTFALQMDEFGRAMAAQLAGSAGEPLLAEDDLGLKVMLSRLTEQPSVLGTAIIGRARPPMVEGVQPPDWFLSAPSGATLGWQWRDPRGEQRAVRSFRSPIRFSDLEVGTALVTVDAGA